MPTVGTVSCSFFVIVFARRKKLRKSYLLSLRFRISLLAGDSRLILFIMLYDCSDAGDSELPFHTCSSAVFYSSHIQNCRL